MNNISLIRGYSLSAALLIACLIIASCSENPVDSEKQDPSDFTTTLIDSTALADTMTSAECEAFNRQLELDLLELDSIEVDTIEPYQQSLGAAAEGFSMVAKYCSIRNGQSLVLSPLRGSGTRSFTVVDATSVYNAKDDDTRWSVLPIPGGYRAQTWGGNKNSKMTFRLVTVAIPSYVSITRRTVQLVGSSDSRVTSFHLRPGYEGVVLLEVLTYNPDGDDDYTYLARAYARRDLNSIFCEAIANFGRSSSRVTLRYTLLSWPKSKSVPVTVTRHQISNGLSRSVAALKRPVVLASLTGYCTDAKAYPWSATRPGISGPQPSNNGSNVNGGGILNDVSDVYNAANSGSIESVIVQSAQALWNFLTGGWGGIWCDDRDDDFSVEVHFKSRSSMTLRGFDGNKYSYGEITVFSFGR